MNEAPLSNPETLPGKETSMIGHPNQHSSYEDNYRKHCQKANENAEIAMAKAGVVFMDIPKVLTSQEKLNEKYRRQNAAIHDRRAAEAREAEIQRIVKEAEARAEAAKDLPKAIAKARKIMRLGKPKPQKYPTIAQMVQHISRVTGFSKEDLIGPSRRRALVRARQRLYYECRMRCGPEVSFPMLAKNLGGRDHTTVLYGVRMHAERNNLPMPDEVHLYQQGAYARPKQAVL